MVFLEWSEAVSHEVSFRKVSSLCVWYYEQRFLEPEHDKGMQTKDTRCMTKVERVALWSARRQASNRAALPQPWNHARACTSIHELCRVRHIVRVK